jgi:hypothetical protein
LSYLPNLTNVSCGTNTNFTDNVLARLQKLHRRRIEKTVE